MAWATHTHLLTDRVTPQSGGTASQAQERRYSPFLKTEEKETDALVCRSYGLSLLTGPTATTSGNGESQWRVAASHVSSLAIRGSVGSTQIIRVSRGSVDSDSSYRAG